MRKCLGKHGFIGIVRHVSLTATQILLVHLDHPDVCQHLDVCVRKPSLCVCVACVGIYICTHALYRESSRDTDCKYACFFLISYIC